MPTIPEQLEALPLLDDFNRANESPMVHGEWVKLPWDKLTGQVLTETWTPKSTLAEGSDGAYWNVSKKNPAIVCGPMWRQAEAGGRSISMWVCVAPGGHNGYRLRLLELAETSKYEWFIEKITAGVATTLASGVLGGFGVGGKVNTHRMFALTALGGVVTAWLKPEVGGWTELGTAADATYTEGFSAIEGAGEHINYWDAVHGGELEPEPEPPPEVEPPVVSGVPLVGEVLSVTEGGWGAVPESIAYHWQEAESEDGPWVDIAGALKSTFELTAEQEGKYIRCVVTAVVGGVEMTQEVNVLGPVEGFVLGVTGEPHGFPDWQPWTARQPTPLYSNAALTLNAETVLGPLYVGGADAIDILLQQTAGAKPYRLTVVWHVGPSRTLPYMTKQFYLHPEAAELHQQVPSEADHVSLIFEPLAAGGFATYRLLVQSSETTVTQKRLGADILLGVAKVEVGAGKSVTELLARTAPGPAVLAASATGAVTTRTVTLEQRNSAAEWVRLFSFPIPASPTVASFPLTLPASPIQAVIGNTGAAAITVDLIIGAT